MVLKRRAPTPSVSPDPAMDAAAAASDAVAQAEAAAARSRGGAATDVRSPTAPERADTGRADTRADLPASAPAPTVTPSVAMKRRARSRQRASRMFLIRIGLVAVMGAMLAVLGSRAFDAWVPSLLIGPIAVSVAALVSRHWRLTVRVFVEFAGVVVATVVAGLATGSDGESLLSDLADGPRRLLTTEWPSPVDGGVVMTIAALVAMCTAVAADLAGRDRFHIAPLAPVAIGFVAVLGVAAPVNPYRWPLAVLALAAFTLLLARPGDDPRNRVRFLASERSMIATLIGLAVATVVASGLIAWTDRSDPRRDVTADLTLSLLDPIEQIAALREVEPPLELFRIADRSTLIGPSLPTRWRTSALTTYDGQRWLPAVTLRPIGRRLGEAPASDPGSTPPIEFDLSLLTDDIDVLPLPGRPLEVLAGDRTIQTDAERSVVRLEQPDVGATIRIVSEIAPTAVEASDASIATRQVDDISSAFAGNAESIGGDGTVLERLRRIESAMRTWQLDPNAPGAGQQLGLIEIFLDDSQRGTREQFVTAFVLLARSIGVDARVATGFLVPPEGLDDPLWLSSDFASVWAEVRLTDRGWFAFDPVPPEAATEPEELPPPPSEQSPAAPQPPVVPPLDRSEEVDPPEEETAVLEVESALRIWAERIGLVGGGILLPVALFVVTVLALKWRRRRRRVRVGEPGRRIVGAWANATDSLVDAGLDIRPAWTDEHIAELATPIAPRVPHELRRLAGASTAMTFGTTTPAATQVDDAIATSRSIDRAILAERTRWQRLRWRLSTRSLRKRSRSPVATD